MRLNALLSNTHNATGGENELAIKDFTLAINVDEAYEPALRNRALEYRRIKKYLEAQEDYHNLHLLTGRLTANQEGNEEEETIESAQIFGTGAKDLYDKNAELTFLHRALFTGMCELSGLSASSNEKQLMTSATTLKNRTSDQRKKSSAW